MTEPISPEILDFIDRVIGSVEEVEILLLLWSDRDRRWTADEVCQELRTSVQSATRRLDGLVRSQLVELREGSYRYAPGGPELERLVGEFAGVYKSFRVRVIERIYSKPNTLKSFADAFRIRKDGV